MKSDRLGKHLVIVALATCVAYFAFYGLGTWLGLRSGPWQAEFLVAEGVPTMRVSQPNKSIRAELKFPGETLEMAAPSTIVFTNVLRTNTPFGTVVFQDLTYLPGVVTLNCFGHELELLPRTLVVDRRQIGWPDAAGVTVEPDWKVPPPAK